MDTRELIDVLRAPGLYPGEGDAVEVRETHISAVFLTREHAYKLKKPVDFGFVDYTTLRKRHFMCKKEVELNRRLATGVYLDVVPVVVRSGRVAVGGPGRVIDYVVKMRRLPDDRTLSVLVDRDAVREGDVARIARRIAQFHATAERSPRIDRFGRPAMMRDIQAENFEQTAPYAGRLVSEAAYREMKEFGLGFIESERALILDRVARGRTCDGHGDLRAEHVYLLDGIQVIDCVEFSPRLRRGDAALDFAFLAMDLDAHGVPDLAEALVLAYRDASGDAMDGVLDFYRFWRAYVRAKVTAFRVDDPAMPEDARRAAVFEARRFFHLALRYARGDRRPTVLLVGGLTGTGKSTLASALAQVFPAPVFSSDPIRKALAGLGPTEHRPDPVREGLYREEMTERVYGEMNRRAEEQLRRGRSAILDATFITRAHREAMRELAARYGAQFLAVECVADRPVIAERIERRMRDASRWSDGRMEIYEYQRQVAEPMDELPAAEHLVVESAAPIEEQVARVVERSERA